MAKFGTLQIQEATAFGVANVLGGDGKVYFENLFSKRHIGRVSDLLSAELQASPDEELRFRIALVAGVFESLRRMSEGSGSPVLIECGVDPEKLALSVSFECDVQEPAAIDESWLRAFVNAVDEPMTKLQEISDALLVRGETANGERRKIEIVSLFARIEARDAIDPEDFRRVHLLCLDGVPRAEARDGKEYVALSRLDHHRLLAPDSPPAEIIEEEDVLIRGITDVIKDEKRIVRGQAEDEEESAVVVRGTHDPVDERVRVQGAAESDGGSVHVRGGSEHEDGNILVKGSAQEIDGDAVRIRGAAESPEQDQVVIGGSYVPERNEDVILVTGEKAARRPKGWNVITSPSGEEIGSEGETPPVASAPPQKKPEKGWLSKIFSISTDSEEEPADQEEKEEEAAVAPDSPSLSYEAETVLPPVSSEGEAVEVEAKKLMKDLESAGMGDFVKRIESRWTVLKIGVKDPEVGGFVDQVVAELQHERNRLIDHVKHLTVLLGNRDHQLVAKETHYQDEIRKRDGVIRHRITMLQAARDQMSKLNLQLQKAQTASQDHSTESALHRRVAFLDRNLATTRQENAALARQVEHFKTLLAQSTQQITTLRTAAASGAASASSTPVATAAAGAGVSSELVSSLQDRLQRSQKQIDEFKRMNRVLLDKLGEAERTRGAQTQPNGKLEELKSRLTQATRQVDRYKQDAETYKKKMNDADAEKLRLKREMIDLQNQVRALLAEKKSKGNAA